MSNLGKIKNIDNIESSKAKYFIYIFFIYLSRIFKSFFTIKSTYFFNFMPAIVSFLIAYNCDNIFHCIF